MSNRRTINDVISPSTNPTLTTGGPFIPNRASQFQNDQSSFILNDNRNTNNFENLSVAELRAENEKLRSAIGTWQNKKPDIHEEVYDESGLPEEFNKRIAYNEEKLSDLTQQIQEQEDIMRAYQEKFVEFGDNLNKLMRLDKDIHSKLVNPEQSSTLEKNVRNVMIALNSGASNEQLIQMIDNIRV